MPETLISADVDAFFHSCLTGWGGAGLKDFAPEQLDADRTAWRDPACIHAMFNDYRAALDADFDLDTADLGKQVTCPALVAYGTDGAMARHHDMAAAWSPRLANMRATTVPGGHFFVDQSPEATAAALLTFLDSLTCERLQPDQPVKIRASPVVDVHFIQRDKGKDTFGHRLAVLLMARTAPDAHVNAHGRSANLHQLSIERHLVPHSLRLMELDLIDGHSRCPPLAHPRGNGARGKVHLAHQPAAKNIARRVGWYPWA